MLYDASEEFQAGGSKTVLDGDDVTLVGAGITLHEALAAAERLASEGISARVIDLYSVKPIDHETLVKAAKETGAIVTVEDHWKEGGIGEAVLAALAEHGASAAVRVLAVEDMPSSATPTQLLRAAEIDAEAIYAAADRDRPDQGRGLGRPGAAGRGRRRPRATEAPSVPVWAGLGGGATTSSPITKMSTATSGSTWMLLMWASTGRPSTASMRSL